MAKKPSNKPIRFTNKVEKTAEEKMLGYKRPSMLDKSKVKLPSRKDLESL